MKVLSISADNLYSFNGSNKEEIRKRERAMVEGWAEMGKFLTSKAPESLKRMIFMGKVLAAGSVAWKAMC